MLKRSICALGLMLAWVGGALATERAAAVADLQKNMAEISALLEKGQIIFQPDLLASNALQALIQAIDPGALLTTPAAAQRYQEETQGRGYDLGWQLTLQEQGCHISAVEPQGPAQTAGITPGSWLLTIAGNDIAGWTLPQIKRALRSGQQATLPLTIRAAASNAVAQEIQVQRVLTQIPALANVELWPQGIGYLQVNGLYAGAGEQIATQLKSWAATNCLGIILDLRDAQGNHLEAVAEIAGVFTHRQPLTFSLQDGRGQTIRIYEMRPNKFLDLPVMVLINRETRAASETLAAVLQQCRGVMLIGEATSGDACLRQALPLSDGRVVYMAVQRVSMVPDNYGVRPDIQVAADSQAAPDASAEDEHELFARLSEQEQHNRALSARIGSDEILRRATDILLGLKALDMHTH